MQVNTGAAMLTSDWTRLLYSSQRRWQYAEYVTPRMQAVIFIGLVRPLQPIENVG